MKIVSKTLWLIGCLLVMLVAGKVTMGMFFAGVTPGRGTSEIAFAIYACASLVAWLLGAAPAVYAYNFLIPWNDPAPEDQQPPTPAPAQPEIIPYQCPHCATTLRIPAHFAGFAGTCNHCENKITVPPTPSRLCRGDI